MTDVRFGDLLRRNVSSGELSRHRLGSSAYRHYLTLHVFSLAILERELLEDMTATQFARPHRYNTPKWKLELPRMGSFLALQAEYVGSPAPSQEFGHQLQSDTSKDGRRMSPIGLMWWSYMTLKFTPLLDSITADTGARRYAFDGLWRHYDTDQHVQSIPRPEAFPKFYRFPFGIQLARHPQATPAIDAGRNRMHCANASTA
ncbi:hypothetical protein B0O80DRAFT_492243 [Mortierella sp. GBAus27b]|nr:hypothetical protein B0O80DRAFT_492243 [Mortierella sp. GBAus27b]